MRLLAHLFGDERVQLMRLLAHPTVGRGNGLLVQQVDLLREAFAYTQKYYPFRMDAVVILPEHLHCIWTLPPDDADFSLRWNVLKGYFSHALPTGEHRSASRVKRRERGIWQRRFWEHLLRDQRDFNQHVDYIHRNPLKHGWVSCVADWQYSSFHRYVEQGIYPLDWCGDDSLATVVGEAA